MIWLYVHPLHPPLSSVSLPGEGSLRKRDNLLTGEGGRVGEEPNHTTARKVWFFNKSFNTLEGTVIWPIAFNEPPMLWNTEEMRLHKEGGHARLFPGRMTTWDYCTVNTLYCDQGVTKRCLLSWLANSALVYGGAGGVAGFQPMSTAVHRSPNKLWRSNSIFNLLLGSLEVF